MIEDYWDAMETTIEEVIIDFPKRTVTILNSEGDETIVPYEFDEEGSQNFQEMVELIQTRISPSKRHYQL